MAKTVKNKVLDIIDHDEYDVPYEITQTEAIIYDWVVHHYGKGEAENPSWNIAELAMFLEDMLQLLQNTNTKYEQTNTVKYKL